MSWSQLVVTSPSPCRYSVKMFLLYLRSSVSAFSRFLSQPFQVAEVFTGHLGKLVPLKDTIAGFNAIRNGDYDHLPEIAFYMVGDISEVVAKAETLAK